MRRHRAVKLTKDGFLGEYFDKKLDDEVLEGIHARGLKPGVFFKMNALSPIYIEGNVTLLDLINAMADMKSADLEAMSELANANIAPYLIDFAKNPDPIPDNDDGQPLEAIEVYRCFELSNYESCTDVFDANTYCSAHGIGSVHSDVKKMVKDGTMTEEQAKNCNTYAIEFTPWQKMLHLPIRMRELVYYSESVWKKCKPKKREIGVLGSKKKFSFGFSDREIVKGKAMVSDKKLTWQMTLQDFLSGLFNELSFFGTPSRRDEEMGVISGRMKDVEKQLKKEKKKKK